MGKLDGKVALVTGAARGQGRSHAIGLVAEGADIVAVDICDQIGVIAYPLATSEDLAETTKRVEELGGDDDQAFYDTIDVNLTGVWHTIRATVPWLIEQDRGAAIVLTSSTAGIRGLHTHLEAGSVAYAASKHGVVGLMRTYANLLGKHNIRVNTVHPTGVNSPMVNNETFGQFVEDHPETAGMLQNILPVRLIEPEDVTRAITLLVSDDARYVTGVTLPVDAGFLNRP
jgi:NAD(P)-dependent dehydrogenase (short-subunit alcohol dehydrogenase family)